MKFKTKGSKIKQFATTVYDLNEKEAIIADKHLVKISDNAWSDRGYQKSWDSFRKEIKENE